MSAAASGSASALLELAHVAMKQGIEQLKAAGTPLHPFFMDEKHGAFFLVDNVGGVDPMSMALPAIRQKVPDIKQCALVIDSRIGYHDGRKWDAIVVMACDRSEEEGVVLAQRYVPKGLFRKLRLEGEPEQIAKSKNFITAAFET